MVHRAKAFIPSSFACLVIVLVGVLLSDTSLAEGQVHAELLGRVTDELSQPIPGATATLVEVGTQVSQIRVTDVAGIYGFVGLQPGSYRLVIELVGFRRTVREGLELHSGERLRIDVELEIGGQRIDKQSLSQHRHRDCKQSRRPWDRWYHAFRSRHFR